MYATTINASIKSAHSCMTLAMLKVRSSALSRNDQGKAHNCTAQFALDMGAPRGINLSQSIYISSEIRPGPIKAASNIEGPSLLPIKQTRTQPGLSTSSPPWFTHAPSTVLEYWAVGSCKFLPCAYRMRQAALFVLNLIRARRVGELASYRGRPRPLFLS
jgi:hypothetical protein